MRIIFMGTPEFAVPSLDILLENGHDVVAVITSTDKLGGRGGKRLMESAVKKYAVEKGLPVLQPKNLKAPEFIEELRSYQADLQIVVAFRMLPEVVWNMPPMGTFNLHGSLLPKYRGAAPINWAIINGEEETGVTTFFLRHEIDTGDLLFQARTPIGENENYGVIYERLKMIGAGLVLKTVEAIKDGDYELKTQDESQVCKAPKIFKETCEVNFAQPTKKVHDFVRGLSPWPGAWAVINTDLRTLENEKFLDENWQKTMGTELKIFETRKEIVAHDFTPGQFVTDGKRELKVATEDGFVNLIGIQSTGRRRMGAGDFLNGMKG